MRGVVVVLVLLFVVLVWAQSWQPLKAVVPSGGVGIVKLVDSDFRERSEVYLGDVVYVLLDLRDFGDVDVSVTIVDESPFGTRTYTGTLRGGQVWGLRFSIVEPICDGCIYTMRVTACGGGMCRRDCFVGGEVVSSCGCAGCAGVVWVFAYV